MHYAAHGFKVVGLKVKLGLGFINDCVILHESFILFKLQFPLENPRGITHTNNFFTGLLGVLSEKRCKILETTKYDQTVVRQKFFEFIILKKRQEKTEIELQIENKIELFLLWHQS